MAVSKAQQRAVNKYVKNNYDEIKLRMPKGKKEIIQAHAAQRGESVNAYINRAIDKALREDDSSTLTDKAGDVRNRRRSPASLRASFLQHLTHGIVAVLEVRCG